MGKEYYFDIFSADRPPLEPVSIAQPAAAVQEPAVAEIQPIGLEDRVEIKDAAAEAQSNQNAAPLEPQPSAQAGAPAVHVDPQSAAYPEPLPGYEIAGGHPNQS